MSSLYFKIRKNESWPDWALCTQQHFPCPKYNADIARYSDVFSRVRRSYSLKAKISENVGIFVLALKRKKGFFFSLFACKRNTPNSEKNLSEISQKRKEKRKITILVKV
jgi:hypothetical protein